MASKLLTLSESRSEGNGGVGNCSCGVQQWNQMPWRQRRRHHSNTESGVACPVEAAPITTNVEKPKTVKIR